MVTATTRQARRWQRLASWWLATAIIVAVIVTPFVIAAYVVLTH